MTVKKRKNPRRAAVTERRRARGRIFFRGEVCCGGCGAAAFFGGGRLPGTAARRDGGTRVSETVCRGKGARRCGAVPRQKGVRPRESAPGDLCCMGRTGCARSRTWGRGSGRRKGNTLRPGNRTLRRRGAVFRCHQTPRTGRHGPAPGACAGVRWLAAAARLWRDGQRLARCAGGGLLALDRGGVQLTQPLFLALLGAGDCRPLAGGGVLRAASRGGARFFAAGTQEAHDAKPC